MNNWTAEKIFNRETFEAWLANQPAERTFNYMDNHGCVVCHFIKETTSAQLAGVGGESFRLNPNYLDPYPLPKWATDLLWDARFDHGNSISINRLRASYQKLFGVDVCAEYPTPATAEIPASV